MSFAVIRHPRPEKGITGTGAEVTSRLELQTCGGIQVMPSLGLNSVGSRSETQALVSGLCRGERQVIRYKDIKISLYG